MEKLLVFLGMFASFLALVGTAGADSIKKGGLTLVPVSEPATVVLFGSGLICLAWVIARKYKKK